MNEIILIPEGEGLEKAYDAYEKKSHRKYETSQQWWEDFASTGIDEWQDCEYKEDLLYLLNNDLHMAMVVHHFIGKGFSSWFHKKDIPVLGGLSPIECLDTEWGTKRLRMIFLQHP